jgi:hypothetical protein
MMWLTLFKLPSAKATVEIRTNAAAAIADIAARNLRNIGGSPDGVDWKILPDGITLLEGRDIKAW